MGRDDVPSLDEVRASAAVPEVQATLQELMNGELFARLVASWERLGRLVYGDGGPPDESLMRAHGIRYMTRYLTAGAILARGSFSGSTASGGSTAPRSSHRRCDRPR